MAAYNPGGSLVWSAALNVTAFQSGVQSMVAQMAFAQRAAAGLESSLKSIAAVSFAGLIAGIGGITAAIAISTKAAAECFQFFVKPFKNSFFDCARYFKVNNRQTLGLLSNAVNATNSLLHPHRIPR